VWGGKVLENNRLLSSYGINSDIVLTAISTTPKVPQDNPFITAPVATPAECTSLGPGTQAVRPSEHTELGATEGQDVGQKASLEHRESFGGTLQTPATALNPATPVVI
jgi:hypothetical protein